MKSERRKPDYDLSALSNTNDIRGKVGAAWINDDGSINIKLNPFVVLNSHDNLQLRLFPYRSAEDWDKRRKEQEEKSAATPSRANENFEDDIPF